MESPALRRRPAAMEPGAEASRRRPTATRVVNRLSAWATALTLSLGLFLIGSGCSRVTVHSQVDPRADFAAYGSFEFLPKGGMERPEGRVPPRLRATLDPLYHAHIQDAVTEDLSEKGMRLAPSRREADLLIGYRTIIRDRADVAPPIYGVGWRGHVYVARPGYVNWYKEGTLVIDIIDRREKHLVWRGVGVGAMRDMRPGDQLKAAVQEILKQFPPQE